MVRDPDTGDEREITEGGDVTASHGSTLLVLDRTGRCRLIDLDRGTTIELRNPGVGRWQRFPSFSPDGSLVALATDVNPMDLSDGPSIDEILEDENELPESPSVMVLIDATTGDIRGVDGQFTNFASEPVWSRDGEWIVFDAPFEERNLYLVHVTSRSSLISVAFEHEPPLPLMDITSRKTLL